MKQSLTETLEGSAVRMFDEAALAPVRQLNAHSLDLLRDCSRHPAWADSAWERALGSHFSRMWAERRAELAQSPVSLLEFAVSLAEFDSGSVADRATQSPPPFLPLEKAVELSQIALTLAWTLSRQDTAATTIVFGLDAVQSQKLRAMDVRDLSRTAERVSKELRPRWLDRPHIWQELLRRPRGTRTARLGPLYLRVLQRQLADVQRATRATRLVRPIRA